MIAMFIHALIFRHDMIPIGNVMCCECLRKFPLRARRVKP